MQVDGVLKILLSNRMIIKTIGVLGGCLKNMAEKKNLINNNSSMVISIIKIYYTIIRNDNIALLIDMEPIVLDNIKKWIIDNNIKSYIRAYGTYENSVNIIHALNIIKRMLCKKNTTYSEEILDPITYMPMTDPILLPDMDNYKPNFFMDRKVIYNILMNKEINPYTKKPLTIYDVNKYNKRQDITKKIKEFKKKYGIK